MFLFAGGALAQQTPATLHTDTTSFCVTFPLFKVCHTWAYIAPAPILLRTVNIKGSVTDKKLTLSGFPKYFEGRKILLKKNEDLLPKCGGTTSEFYILAGEYKILRGVTVMKLERVR